MVINIQSILINPWTGGNLRIVRNPMMVEWPGSPFMPRILIMDVLGNPLVGFIGYTKPSHCRSTMTYLDLPEDQLTLQLFISYHESWVFLIYCRLILQHVPSRKVIIIVIVYRCTAFFIHILHHFSPYPGCSCRCGRGWGCRGWGWWAVT